MREKDGICYYTIKEALSITDIEICEQQIRRRISDGKIPGCIKVKRIKDDVKKDLGYWLIPETSIEKYLIQLKKPYATRKGDNVAEKLK